MDLRERKAWLRRRLCELRDQLPSIERSQASRAIRSQLVTTPEVVDARSAFVFISHGTEAETHSLIDHLLARGLHLTVPRVVDDRRMVAAEFPGWEALVPGTMGILTTRSSNPDPVAPDIVITPGLGFAPTGDRLGHGRGYYDRWFRANPAPVRIAVPFDVQLIDRLPVHHHDMPVDIIVTEHRVVRTGRRPPSGS